VNGVLVDVINERPLIISGNQATLLTPAGQHTYSERHLDLTVEVSTGYYGYGSIKNQYIPHALAKDEHAAYFRQVAVTASGQVFKVPSGCSAGRVALLPAGDAIALCRTLVVRLRRPDQ
jgi:hypothetical protein